MTIRASMRISLALFLVLLAVVPAVQPSAVFAAADYPLDDSDSVIQDAVEYLIDEQGSDGNIDGFVTSAWAVMALAAAEEEDAVADLIAYLEDEAGGYAGEYEATDWARMILAIVAAGEDPTDFDGDNYVDGLLGLREVEDETGYDYNQIGDPELLNDDIWGILALEAAGESVDNDIIDFVLEWQNSDGGWGIDIFSDSDVDVTAAAVMALIASGADADEPEIEDALDFLLDVQNSDGGFPEEDGGQSNAASDAWAIMAIMAADGDPNSSEWDKSGDNAVDHLLELQDTDGFFNFTDGDDVNPEWMTCYAIPALLGLPYPVPALEASSGSGDAEIEVSPAELVFYATEGGDDPLDREIVIINAGSGDMDWDVDVDESWLDVSPSSGTSDDEGETVTVSIDISGLDADDYHGTITITADDADNSPESIDVSLYVEEATTDNVVMFYPEEFEFVGDLDEDENPADQVLEIWNSGPDAIDWEIEVDCDEGWLTVSPDDGELDEEHVSIRLRVDIEGLDPDDYDATITIIADEAENDGETIPVSLEVTGSAPEEDAEIEFSPSRLEFEATVDDDDPDPKTLEVWNSGGGRLYWAVSADEDWLQLSPSSGSSNGEKDSIEVSVDISGLDEDEYSAEITIEDEDDSRNIEVVRVTLVLEEDEPDSYMLVATATPAGAGTIQTSVAAGATGYPAGTMVTLTATANEGYSFVGWSGDAAGSSPSTTIVVDNHRSVVAKFLRFTTGGLTNVKLAYVPPDLTELAVLPYPVESIPSDPPGFVITDAVVVQPKGGGTFALEFNSLANADYVALFQVVNGAWTQVPRTVLSPTSLQVSLPVADTVLVFATPGSSSGELWKKVTGFFESMDTTMMIVIGVAGVLAIVVVALIVVLLRRDSY